MLGLGLRVHDGNDLTRGGQYAFPDLGRQTLVTGFTGGFVKGRPGPLHALDLDPDKGFTVAIDGGVELVLLGIELCPEEI